MSRTAADFLMAQEVRVPKGYPRQAAGQAASGEKWSLAIEPCSVAKGGGRSVATVVASRNYIGMAESQPVVTTQHMHATERFTMKRVAAVGKVGVRKGSIHLHSTVGVEAKRNLDILETVAFTLGSLTAPWMVGGD